MWCFHYGRNHYEGFVVKVLRAMRAGEDGLPQVGETGRYLAVRRSGKFRDIDIDESGAVRPEAGGMSVAPPPPENLPEQLRPPEYGGYGKDFLFELDTDELAPELRYRSDPKNPMGHGFIEPSEPMSFEEFERAVHETRELWTLVR